MARFSEIDKSSGHFELACTGIFGSPKEQKLIFKTNDRNYCGYGILIIDPTAVTAFVIFPFEKNQFTRTAFAAICEN